MFTVRTILNPRDFSEPSAEAHKMACDIARQHRAKLVFLHVTDKPVVSYFEKATEFSPGELQQKLFEILKLPTDCEAGLTVEHRVVEGDAVKQILAIAAEIKSDLIVLGTQGKTGMSRWFSSGSVAEEIVRKSPCSVLVAKAVVPAATMPATNS